MLLDNLQLLKANENDARYLNVLHKCTSVSTYLVHCRVQNSLTFE